MGYPTSASRSVRALELSADDAFHFDRLAHSLLDEALFEYDHFVTHDRRRVDAAQWRHWRQDDDVVVYRERHTHAGERSESLLDPQHDVAPSSRLTAFTSHTSGSTTHGKTTTTATTMPRLLAVGSLATSLDDVLYGVVTPTAAAMRLRAAYASSDDYLDGAVLATVRAPTPSEPFQFLGIKWLLQRGLGGGMALVRPRDYVFLESTGVQIRQDGSGQRVGFHIMHSVELPMGNHDARSHKVQRGAFSTCYLYHELADGAVDVYMTAVVQPRGNLIAPVALRAAAAMLTGNWRALVLFAETKKLAWLLETHRQLHGHGTSLPSSHAHAVARCGLCATSFKGFTKATKKRVACQLCSMSVCAHCSVARTLRSEGFARNSVVATEMRFCKKCVALASEESASEIARQQLWEHEVVRTGRAQTQTALALARRETSSVNGSRLLYQHQSLSMERGFAGDDALTAYRPHENHMRATWHDSDPGASTRRYDIYDDRTDGIQRASTAAASSVSASTASRNAVPRGSTAKGSSVSGSQAGGRRRTTNSTWNGSGRATETLSIGTIDYRTSSFHDAAAAAQCPRDDHEIAARASTVSSALVLLDDRTSSRHMKALDYLPQPMTADDAAHSRASIVSSSVYTDGGADFEVDSVYSVASGSSSVAVLDLEASRQQYPRPSMSSRQPLTITEEPYDPQPPPSQHQHQQPQQPRSELEAFYLEQQRLQKLQQLQLQQRQQHMQRPHQHQHQRRPYEAPRSSNNSSMILLEPHQTQQPRSSRVRFNDTLTDVRSSEILPPASRGSTAGSVSASTDGEQRLSYQMQLWLQMNELRDTAESTYQITQRNTDAIASQNPKLFRDMRFFSQQPLGSTGSGGTGLPRRMTSATPPPPQPLSMPHASRPVFSPMASSSRRSSMPLSR